jgi:RNA polymerase sigma-70 factor (ECF subfamily)
MTANLRTRFEALHKQHQSMVLHLCRGFAKGDRDQAQDLCQEVFVNAWHALAGFRSESSEKTWIYRITVNTCLMWIRKEKKKSFTQRADEATESIAERFEDHDRVETLYRAIGQLEEVDRLIIMMVLDELEYEEISRVVGITENNLRVRVHRIKQRLKAIFNDGKRNG